MESNDTSVAIERDRLVRRMLRVGIVGTGFAAKRRAEAFRADSRAQVVAVAGRTPESTAAFAQDQEISTQLSWQALVERESVDLVVVCHANGCHAEVVHAALNAGKSVVVEYPLALSVAEATALVQLSQQRQLFLHVEHIELLGGLHQAMQTHLPKVGTPAYARYCTASSQHPAPPKWAYKAALFGFPLMGALSRLHRFVDLFGPVNRVSCQLQYDGGVSEPPDGYFRNCRCVAQLQFHSGVVADVLYAKGEQTWRSRRLMEVEGDDGALIFEGDEGTFIGTEATYHIAVATRRGLFAKDTVYALDALLEGIPLYITPERSLYVMRVAAAAEQSARTGQTVAMGLP